MADELPEKVRAEDQLLADIETDGLYNILNAALYDGDLERVGLMKRAIKAGLAIEESTRELREKLENAEEGYARRHKDATDLWEKINFPGGLNAQILELRERLERAQGALRECPGITGDYSVCWPDKHALAIREAKE